MRILTLSKLSIYCFILHLTTPVLKAQENTISIKQNPKFEELLNEKRKFNSSITVNERYKIQIFSGSSEGAKKALYDSKKDFSTLDATIVFNTPNYKVWLGNFRTRMEAEHHIIDVKKKYSNALLIKPK